MTRELKLALLIGFSAVLVVAVLISDHFNQYKRPRIAPLSGDQAMASTFGVENTSVAGSGISPERPLTPTKTYVEPVRGGGEGGGVVIPQGSKPMGGSPSGVTGGGPQTSPLPIDLTSKSPAKADREHVVASGDTFYQLAKKYYNDGSLADKLVEYNKDRVGKQAYLKIGQKLAIPDRDVLTGKAPAAGKPGLTPNLTPNVAPSPAPSETLKKLLDNEPVATMATNTSYTVREGDTLYAIANTNGVRISELLDANPTLKSRPDTLTVGMKISLPKGR